MKRRNLVLLAAASLAAFIAGPVVAAASDTPDGRVIVKFREGSALKQIQAAGRVQSIASRLGLSARFIGQPSPDLHVMQASGIDAETLAARLGRESDVEYAVPDRRKQIKALPNDPLYPHQWYLQAANATQPAATNAITAWNTSAGSSSVIVAVVDTGVRLDHEDLAGRLVPGYDFISDDLNSGDGQAGRDADPSDPGDYVSASDLANRSFSSLCTGATISNSSWHGTQVASIVAADSNNSKGIAGIGGTTRILPVRALGKCGGFDSDIIAGMRWAAGLPVPGVPANPNPARIINLSLAGAGACSAAYTSAVAEVTAAGALVVAAAGNESGPVEEPANCPGVLAVAGLRHAGTKVGYSSLGFEVGISAPAGNCINVARGSPCLYPFINATNLGTTDPAANGYTGITDSTVGTSFAAPLVSGAAALMIAAHPGLSAYELKLRLKQSTSPFPTDSTLPVCPSTTIDGQCNCTVFSCGSGMLNAAGAVSAALNPSAVISVSGSPVAATATSLSAADSTVSGGTTATGWQWTLLGGPATASFSTPNAVSTGFTAPVAGTYTISLTVTDSAGRSGNTTTTLSVLAAAPAPAPAPTSSGGGGGALDLTTLSGLAVLSLIALSRQRKVRL